MTMEKLLWTKCSKEEENYLKKEAPKELRYLVQIILTNDIKEDDFQGLVNQCISKLTEVFQEQSTSDKVYEATILTFFLLRYLCEDR